MMTCLSSAGASAGGPSEAAGTACSDIRQARLESLRDRQLHAYNSAFPDIRFITLPTDGDWQSGMAELRPLLGAEPTVLDYEHPSDLAAPLRQVSLHRIALLMRHEIPSASLFEVGEDARAARPKLCVITLAPCAIARDDAQATAFMLQLPSAWPRRMRPQHRLDADAYLGFSIDHEAFHCLDAAAHGGMPLGHATYWGEYWRTRNEMGADAFAVAMAVWRTGEDARPFLTNLARLRGLALYDGDPQHFSHAAITAILARDRRHLQAMTPQQLVALAHRVAAQQLPDYASFQRFWGSAHAAMAKLGIAPGEDGNQAPGPEAPLPVDEALVDEMVTLSKRLHAELSAP